METYIKNLQTTPRVPHLPKVVNDLYSTFKHFTDEKCLIVVNNFEGSDIQPTIEFPVILRNLDIAVGQITYLNPYYNKKYYKVRTFWTHKEKISKLNGNFSIFLPYDTYTFNLKECFRWFSFVYSLWSTDVSGSKCVDENLPNFFCYQSRGNVKFKLTYSCPIIN